MNLADRIKQFDSAKRTILLIACCTLALTMCVPITQYSDTEDSVIPQFTTIASEVTAANQFMETPGIPLGEAYACLPRSTLIQSGIVEKVVDGDTIHVVIEGKMYVVRYIGVDTPETHHPVRGVEPYGAQAAERNQEMVSGKNVTLVKDVSETDQYDRLLRYVLAGDVFVNAALVKEGYARAVTYPPDTACSEEFIAKEALARQKKRGLWGLPTATPPTNASNVISEGIGCDEEQTGCAIKGNINADDVKIYHHRGRGIMKNHASTQQGEKWFCT